MDATDEGAAAVVDTEHEAAQRTVDNCAAADTVAQIVGAAQMFLVYFPAFLFG